MAQQDRIVAKVERVTLYRRGGNTLFLKWYNPKRGRRGNYQRRSTKTSNLRQALHIAVDLNEALSSGDVEADKVALGPTLVEAAQAHPATTHEERHYPADYRRHAKSMAAFVRFSGSPLLRELRVEKASKWVEKMKADGLGFESRRHALLFLRRASALAPNYGFTDVLNGLRLDRREQIPEINALDAESMRSLQSEADKMVETRWSAAIALMGFMGLRPSEVVRLKVSDIEADGTLNVGARRSKNESSRRSLPIPAVVAKRLEPMAAMVDPDQSLLGFNASESSNICMLSRGIKRILRAARFDSFAAKDLRKSFTTICINELGVDPVLVEGFLGHKHPAALGVTRRHYLRSVNAKRLNPVADAIDSRFH